MKYLLLILLLAACTPKPIVFNSDWQTQSGDTAKMVIKHIVKNGKWIYLDKDGKPYNNHKSITTYQ